MIEYQISELVTIQYKYSSYELSQFDPIKYTAESYEHLLARMTGYNPTKIRIKSDWFDVLPISVVARSKSPVDGGFHFVYIQINLSTNEYYVGKVNRKRWSEINRYQGSGLKFKGKYKGHEAEYIRYFIARCSTSDETETLEAEIVDKDLLKDPKCLNLVCGGGGTSEHYDKEKRATRQREIMAEHPEFYQSMVGTAKQLYQSGDTAALQRRSEAIKATMSDDHYRQLMSDRIKTWKAEHPEEYQRSRENNRLAQQNPDVKAKKVQGRKKWAEEHPEENRVLQEKLNKARNSPEARKKKSDSLKKWYAEHPEEAKANVTKRSDASAEKCRKAVNMCDLETGEVIKTFKSLQEAAQWLLDNGLTTSKNSASSISAVCRRVKCTTGYGYRKKAFGYDWQYASADEQ